MRNLRRLAASIAAVALVVAFSSCEKQPAADAQQDVTFSINNVTNSLKKGIVTPDNPNDETVIPNCSSEAPAYVMIGMDGAEAIKLPILSGLNDGTETVVMKLPAEEEHTINSFMVYDADGNLIWAAPMNDSHYAQLWGLDGLEKKFTVEAFAKNAVTVDVLCWEEYSYKEFGFNWFDFQEVTIKTMCFFGDICTKFYDDFYNTSGSPYNRGDGYEGGYDMPAIFQVLIKDKATGEILNDENMNSNASWYGEGSPLCIEYPDFGDIDNEEYTFEIYLAYPDGTYNLIYSQDFMAEDDQASITGEDGVFDFVVGNCSYDGNTTNIELPPYLYLPENGHVMIMPAANTGITYEYFDVKLLGTSWNNSLFPDELAENEILGAYCGDLYSLISGANAEYDVNIFSSLEPGTMPSTYNSYPWGALNWLANQGEAITNNEVEGKYLQAIVWFIIHRDQIADNNGDSHTATELFNKVKGSLGISTTKAQAAKAIADYALDTMGNFEPETGQYSVVLFDPIETTTPDNTVGTANIQLVLVRVDP